MKFVIDCGNIERIKKVLAWFPADQVSVNPSLVAKEGIKLFDLLDDLLEISPGVVHVQVLGNTKDQMVEEAKRLHAIDPERVIVKIPVSKVGFEAMKELQRHEPQIRITATAVITVGQALTAAKYGAYVVAPYVSRMDRAGFSGVAAVGQMTKMLRAYGYQTKLIAASVKNVQEINELIELGADAVALDPEVFESLIQHHLTDQAIEGFESDWLSQFNELSIDATIK